MSFWQRFLNNPILLKEMDVRSRKPDRYRGFNYAGPATQLAIVIVPLVFFIVAAVFEMIAANGLLPIQSGALRSGAWTALGTTLIFQLLYFLFNSSAFTAGSLTVEKEQNTYEILMSIPMSVPWLITGKLLGSVAPLLVELGLSVPIYCFYCIAGTIPILTTVKIVAFFLVIIYCFGALGLWLSARHATTVKALGGVKNLVLAFLFGPLALAYIGIFVSLGSPEVASSMLKLEPYYLLITYIFPVNAGEMAGIFDCAVVAFYVILPLCALRKTSTIITRLHRG